MRLLKCSVLLGTAWAHRHPPEAETAQQVAYRPFRKRDAVALLDQSRKVDPPPPYHPMLG